ncbi:oxidoreductase [Neohortaea acidophila]|uniref:Oxidoreductase n=1 Tax=Neohortaea acidophila TaxID=245834 RepID=A0A6A6PIH0_9PEZI|nr:oxidoreductase [Neohortaea acidophila]KAF2479586.1 oxidoreductase [Neohortaea acidophila]
MSSPKLFAVIAGVGEGTGAALARRFAKAYPVVLLARKESSFKSLVDEIQASGQTALGISTDVSQGDSVKSAFEQVKKTFGSDVSCAAAVFNASGAFSRKPFLELTEDDFTRPYSVSGIGAFHFSQAVLPLLLKHADPTHLPPTLIFTGATASLKASVGFSGFAAAKFSQRALAQALAREFGPQGVHVSHVVIDGLIDTPGTAGWMQDAGPNGKLQPPAIAEFYWGLHAQPLSTFTFETEIRPFKEKW